jgi:hypothetical protein
MFSAGIQLVFETIESIRSQNESALNWKSLFFILLVVAISIKFYNNNDDATQSQRFDDYTITSLESFEIQARVLSSTRYFLDRESDLAPVDLALGWGVMADTAITDQIEISQRNRWYYWHVDTFPIPRNEIESNSANMHLIPATPQIESAIKSVKVGQMVKFSGDLVEVKGKDGWHWKSSQSRHDTGAGACEVVLVKSFNML